MILLFAAISLVSTGYTNHHVTDEPPRGGWGGYTPQSQPGAALGAQSQPRQGSLGENSLNLRYLPSDEAKDKVAPAGMGPAGTHQVHPGPRGGSGTRPPPDKGANPDDATSAPYLSGTSGLSYEPDSQRAYTPQGPHQSTLSLNLDSLRAYPDGFYADLHGLKANVLLFQDYRMTGAQTRRFLLDASQKVFRAKKRCCAASSDPAPGLDGRMYGGALVMVHPHYTGRIVARFSDNRGLGRYAALTLRGKNGTLMTFISVYLTPALSGENGQAAAQQRYIDNHPGTLPTQDPYELAVRDIAELVSDRHRAGSAVVLGGGICRQTSRTAQRPGHNSSRNTGDGKTSSYPH